MEQPQERAREFQRETRRNAKLSLKEILAAPGEPIAEDGFDYTEVPYRLSQAPGTLKFDAHTFCQRLRGVRSLKDLEHDDYCFWLSEKSSDEYLNDFDEESNLVFLYNEVGNRYWRGFVDFPLKQARALLREAPDDLTEYNHHLNCVPLSEDSLKFDVVAESDLSIIGVTRAIRSLGWKSIEKVCKEIKEFDSGFSHLKEDPEFQSDDKMSVFEDYLHEKISRYICFLIIGNARVIEDKVYFPNSKDHDWLATISRISNSKFGIASKAVTPQIVIRLLPQIVLEQIFTIPGSSSTFCLKEQFVEEYLWAKVLYLPTPRAKQHFRNNFLHPRDEILEWTSREQLIDDQWVQADVRIRLGSDLVPPKRPIVDRLRRNLQHLLNENPNKRKLRAVTRSISHAKPHRVVYDKYEMSCSIRFCWEYCSYCHRTGHIITECEKSSLATAIEPFRRCGHCGLMKETESTRTDVS